MGAVLVWAVALALAMAPCARGEELVQQGSKLTVRGEIGDGEVGGHVALAGDGETALIGGVEGTYVFGGSGSAWVQQATLPAGEGLALSGDGSTALIASGSGTFVFTRSGSTWTQTATLAAGVSVAVSSDGDTALVGAPAANSDTGVAWVYRRAGESWAEQAELKPSEENGAGEFGYSVALSADGSTALVGAPEDQPDAPEYAPHGAAWVFTRSGEAWPQQGGVIPGPEFLEEDGSGAEGPEGSRCAFRMEFATGVALSADGDTALIGGDERAGYVCSVAPNEGAAWVYTRSGSTWTQPGTELRGEPAEGVVEKGRAGESVSLSGSADAALIGGDLEAGLGAAWLFTQSGQSWNTAGAELQGNDEIGAFSGLFGAAVALSSAGDVALIGDPRDNNDVGAAWIFAASPTVTALDQSSGPAAGGTTVTITGANLSEASAVTFGSVDATSFTVNSGTSITAVSPPGAGTVDVTVNTPLGRSPTGVADRFSYSPAVTSVTPDSGPFAGGTPVTITGSGFTGASAVRFGSIEAENVTVNSDTSITAVSPPGAGTVDVTVETPEGATASTGADRFAYAKIASADTGASDLGELITGSEGDMWFIDSQGIGRVTPQGTVTLFSQARLEDKSYAFGRPEQIAATGSAGKLWARFSVGLEEYTLEDGALALTNYRYFFDSEHLEAMTVEPGGRMCYAAFERLNEYEQLTCNLYIPKVENGGSGSIRLTVAGTSGDLWATWDPGHAGTNILRGSDGSTVRQYPVGSKISAIAVGQGDDLWFTDSETHEVGRLTPEGALTRFSYGITGSPSAITAGPEGDMWFTEPGPREIGRITPEGVVTQFSEGITSPPVGVTAGPEGDVWFTEESGRIGRLTTSVSVEEAPAITSASNATFTEGSEGSFTPTASGLPAPGISESGALAAGVSFSHGVLSGAPTQSGSFPITFTAGNGVGSEAVQSFTLTVDAAPEITSANETTFTEGTPGSFTVRATGVPAPGISESGTLPSGVTFSGGVLSGTPMQEGVYAITFTASNGVGSNAAQSFTLTVDAPPAITSANSTQFEFGTSGTFEVTASGTPSPTVTEWGALPKGVTFDTGGTLTGTPSEPGSFELTFEATNGIGSPSYQEFLLKVLGLHVTTTSLPEATTGVRYSAQLTAAAGTPPYHWQLDGVLPAGLRFKKTGAISGRPKATAQSALIALSVTDSGKPRQEAPATLLLKVF